MAAGCLIPACNDRTRSSLFPSSTALHTPYDPTVTAPVWFSDQTGPRGWFTGPYALTTGDARTTSSFARVQPFTHTDISTFTFAIPLRPTSDANLPLRYPCFVSTATLPPFLLYQLPTARHARFYLRGGTHGTRTGYSRARSTYLPTLPYTWVPTVWDVVITSAWLWTYDCNAFVYMTRPTCDFTADASVPLGLTVLPGLREDVGSATPHHPICRTYIATLVRSHFRSSLLNVTLLHRWFLYLLSTCPLCLLQLVPHYLPIQHTLHTLWFERFADRAVYALLPLPHCYRTCITTTTCLRSFVVIFALTLQTNDPCTPISCLLPSAALPV